MTYSRLWAHCTEALEAEDDRLRVGDECVAGSPLHEECAVRVVMGSVPHQMQQCSCYGGTMEEPTDKTRRQNALAALAYFRARMRATASANELNSGMVN